MNSVEAFELTMRKVLELQGEGIKVIIKEARSRKDMVNKEIPASNDRIAPKYWTKISFKPIDSGQKKKIFEIATNLGILGITFDNGGSEGLRVWELDWSFQNTGEENYEYQLAREEIEEEICKTENLG